MQKKKRRFAQSAVIPFLEQGPDRLRIVLITNRSRKRWVIPKGLIESNMTGSESAAKEALEEAGIEGQVSELPVCHYQFKKWGGVCEVDVYLMRVTRVYDQWPEDFLRNRKWLDPQVAREKLREKELQEALENLPALINNSTFNDDDVRAHYSNGLSSFISIL